MNVSLEESSPYRFLDEIRHGLQDLCGHQGPDQLVHMCGSGVTACQNLFSAELVGLKGSTLYVGSWSEWIQDPSRPIGKLPTLT
jgi:thiosulfate/3-mercaptopyruvate sulfurtransferase